MWSAPALAFNTGGDIAAAASALAEGASTPVGVAAFAAAHVLAIALCFPGTIAFEAAAGAIFGFLPGAALVALVKGSATALTYLLVTQLEDGPMGTWLQERVRGQDGEGYWWAERIRAGVQRDSFRFCVLARLSPVPSWVNNYVLPLAGVPLATYLPASLLGMLLPLASNVYSGAAAASLAAALSGGGSGSDSLGGFDMVLPALSAASGMAIVQQLAGESLAEIWGDGSKPSD